MGLKLCISLQSYATAFVSLFTNRVKPIAKAMATTPKTASLAADTKGLIIGSVTIASYSSIATHWLPEGGSPRWSIWLTGATLPRL